MLVLFDTPAGHALFKVLDESKMKKPDDLWEAFQDVGSTRKLVKLKQFHKLTLKGGGSQPRDASADYHNS